MAFDRNIAFVIYGIQALLCLMFTSLDFSILIHLSFIQKKKGFCYVLALSASCFFGLFFWMLVPAYELQVLPRTADSLYYRCLVYPWLDNTFFCSNAYIIVALCIDRFVALYKPHSYYIWARNRTRAVVTSLCFLLSFAVTSKWYNFVSIAGSIENHTAYCSENINYTHSTSYRTGKYISIILQYYAPAILMLVFTGLNVKKVNYLKKQYASNLRIFGASYKKWLELWDRMTKISIGLAVIFCCTNLPFSIFEFDFREAAYTRIGFKIFQFMTNLLQIFSTQINIILICYFSKAYRNTALILLDKVINVFKCKIFTRRVNEIKHDDSCKQICTRF